MAENIYDILRNEQPRLTPMLDKNHDVCTFLMSSYAYLLSLVMETGRNAEDMDLSINVIKERLIKIDISWKTEHEGATSLSASKLPYQRNMSLVSFLKSNDKILNLARDVVYVLERWLKGAEYRKDIGYEQIRVENVIAWRDGRTITGELVLKTDYAQMTKERLNVSRAEAEQLNRSNIVLTDEMLGS
jgi:hypothetical protein